MSEAALLMDRMYRHQRYFYDATRKFYLLGRDDLIANVQPPVGGRVLEIGCGTGRNLVKLAQTYRTVHCFGLDVSQVMLESARTAATRAGLADRFRLAQGDATSFDPQILFGQAAFERIVISYALSMIPSWQAVLEHAVQHVVPGGSLHIVDFGDQAALPAAFRRSLHRWLALFHVTPRSELPAALETLSRERGYGVRSVSRFRGYALHSVVTRPAVPRREMQGLSA